MSHVCRLESAMALTTWDDLWAPALAVMYIRMNRGVICENHRYSRDPVE